MVQGKLSGLPGTILAGIAVSLHDILSGNGDCSSVNPHKEDKPNDTREGDSGVNRPHLNSIISFHHLRLTKIDEYYGSLCFCYAERLIVLV